MQISKRLALPLVVIACAMITSPLLAGNCTWRSEPTSMVFNYDVFGGDTPAVTPFSFQCTPNQWARITISPVADPRKAGAADYNIYLSGSGGAIWGDGVTGGSTYDQYNSTPGNKNFSDDMFGIAPAGQDLVPGTYTATLTVQLATSTSQTGPWTNVGTGVLLSVQINVVAKCRIDAFNLAFGQYDPFSTAALNQTSTVKVFCTIGTRGTASLDYGLHAVGTQRKMASPSGVTLDYNAALSGAVTDVSSSSLVALGGGFPLSGAIPPQQDVPVDSYKDTLQAIVQF